MLLKLGVSIEKLNRPCRRALPVVGSVIAKFGEEVIVTSTYEGNHSEGSLHYGNAAFDVRLPVGGVLRVLPELREKLGGDFTVLAERDHLHIEHDPKGS